MVVRGDEALRPRRRAEIEVIANRFRETIGLTGRVYGVRLFERLDELIVNVDGEDVSVDYGVKELDWGVLACTTYNPTTQKLDMFLTPATYEELRRGNPRALFTLAHECGHIVLHSKELIIRATQPVEVAMNRRKMHEVFRDTEWQSDTFAGAFIAPLRDVLRLHDDLGEIGATDLTREFGLSRQASAIRLGNITYLTQPGRVTVAGGNRGGLSIYDPSA